jgi:hypothetical protein
MSKVSLAGNASGTGIFTIASPNSNTDRTLTLPDNTGTLVTNTSGSVSQAMLASGVAGTGPAFSAYASSPVSITANVSTKVPVNTVNFDTNSYFDTANRWFRPALAGYYQINYGFESNAVASGYFIAQLKMNGVTVGYSSNYPSDASFGPAASGSILLYMNGSTDYVELYAQSSASRQISGNTFATLNGFLARSA